MEAVDTWLLGLKRKVRSTGKAKQAVHELLTTDEQLKVRVLAAAVCCLLLHCVFAQLLSSMVASGNYVGAEWLLTGMSSTLKVSDVDVDAACVDGLPGALDRLNIGLVQWLFPRGLSKKAKKTAKKTALTGRKLPRCEALVRDWLVCGAAAVAP